jgi:hypothetical protein
MDEILTANFSSSTTWYEQRYDLWIADEAELDYYLHENPARNAPRSCG